MPVPVDLSKLNDVVKNDVVNKTAYDKLVAKVESIDTSKFVFKKSMTQVNQNMKVKVMIPTVFLKK